MFDVRCWMFDLRAPTRRGPARASAIGNRDSNIAAKTEHRLSVIQYPILSSFPGHRLRRASRWLCFDRRQHPGECVEPRALRLSRTVHDRCEPFQKAVHFGKILLTIDGFGPLALAPLSETLFRVVDFPGPAATIAFDMGSDASPERLTMQLAGDTSRYVFPILKPLVLSPEEALDYTGLYRSDEVDAVYRVVYEEGRLRIRVESRAGWVFVDSLNPVETDVFRDSEQTVTFRFVRDQAGRVSEMIGDSDRVTCLSFARLAD